MPTITIPATNAYRSKVATAAASGGTLPAAYEIAFGTGTTAPSPDDTGLEEEVYRKSLDSAEATDTVMTVVGTLTGEESTDPITEVGIFDADGTLMGRRSFAPKTLEEESSLKFTLHFQF